MHIERDAANKIQEQQVLQQMQSIIQQHTPKLEQKLTTPSDVQFVGMEQALRELLELEKKIT